MNVAVITDIPVLCTKTMYLDELRTGMRKFDVRTDLYLISGSKSPLEGKVPIQRLLGASLLLRKVVQYNLIHVQFSFPLGFLYAVSKIVHRKPLLIHTHGVDIFSVPNVSYGLRRNQIGRAFARQAWAGASHIIAVCETAKAVLLDAGVPPQKISVLYNGVNTQLFKKKQIEDKKLVRIKENCDLVFLNVAGLTPVKNHRTLLAAFSLFVKTSKAGRNSKLVICGEGPLKPSLLAFAHELRIHQQLVFLGQQPHSKMAEVYSLADAYVFPSLSEAHPWSILEAMSCSLPSIASSVGGIPETIQDKRFLFNPHSSESVSALCDRMVFMANDAKMRREIGAKNRAVVMNQFTIQHHLKKMLQIYTEMMS